MFRWIKSDVHICIVGAFVLAVGIDSLISMVAGLILGNERFGPGFILIWVGLGLLRGSSLQRGLFGGVMALMIVGVTVMIIVNSFYEAGYWIRGEGQRAESFWMGWVLAAGVIYGFVVLWHAKSDPWFAEESSGTAPRFVIPVTVVLAVFFSGGFHYHEYLRKERLAEVFRYDLEVEVVDAATGEPVKGLVVGTSGGELGDLDLPKFITSRSSGGGVVDGRVRRTFSGFARGALHLDFEAKGYESQSLDVTSETKEFLTIRLEPLARKSP